MRKSAFKAGKIIIREGDPGNDAYIIVDGQVEITRKTKDGSEIVLAKLGDNQMFGEVCMIEDTLRRTASVKALTDVIVAIVPQQSFNEKLQATPVAVKSIIKVLAKRLADSNDMLIDLHSKIQNMVEQKIGDVIAANKTMAQELKEKNEEIESLKEEIEKLRVSGPPKQQKQQQKEGQRLEKDRSMKLSLKDLDAMAKKSQEE